MDAVEATQIGGSVESILVTYKILLFGGGLICLAHFFLIQRSKNGLVPALLVRPWRISLIDSFLFMWAVLFVPVLFQSAIVGFYEMSGGPQLSESREAFIGAVTTQLALLSVFYLARSYIPLSLEEGEKDLINSKILGIGGSLRIGCYACLAAIPLIEIISRGIVYAVENWLPDFPTQDLVRIIGESSDPLDLGLLVLIAITLPPIAEELIFRAGVYRFLKGKMSPTSAMMFSSILFALVHWNALSFIPLLFLSMIMTYCYELTGNIKVPIFIHFLFNFNSVIFLLSKIVLGEPT